MFAEGLNRAARQSVIGRENRSDLALSGINGLQHEKVRLGSQPVFGIPICDHFDVAAIDIGPQNAHLCVMQNFRILGIWRTRDQYIISRGGMFY